MIILGVINLEVIVSESPASRARGINFPALG
jgi:hypothetical protein